MLYHKAEIFSRYGYLRLFENFFFIHCIISIRSLRESPIVIMQKIVIKIDVKTTIQKRMKFSGIAKCIIVGIMQAVEVVQNIGSKEFAKNAVIEKGVKCLIISRRAAVAMHEMMIVTVITE